MLKKGCYRFGQVLSCVKGFLVAIEFRSCVMIVVHCVATWFSGCRQLHGRDIAFSCCDDALFLCHDDVATKVSLSRPRRPRQEVRCCNRLGLG